MRKKQKNELQKIISTLQQAINSIGGLFQAGNMQKLSSLLADCQDAAVAVGEAIEQSEGEGTATVRFLEEFCELLYETANQTDPLKQQKCYKKLNSKLSCASNSIKYDIPEQKLIVFLPYKASMWDSLESVYLAAKEDPGCIALVMPIPYFDKNVDGTLGEMHDETDEYGENIEIADWKTTDLQQLHPEVIFFHNPYDDSNLVTTVHPAFYSDKLRQMTDQLVYIPYFICDGDVPEHFCKAKGVFRADKVIVQSEQARATYIKVWVETLGEEYRKLAEERILALGSPKLDKVLSTMRDDSRLPEEWKKKIYTTDADGKRIRKKVILYNNSIQTALDHHDKYLNKLEDVLKFFQSNTEVVLWWRPHPLLHNTLCSMYPELAEEYERITEWYKKAAFGIYDDTADLHRSIAESDAYYGDNSSLVALYKATGKPIMIENVDVRCEV